MPYKSYIKELQSIAVNSVHTIDHIHWWLMKYEMEYHSAINSTSCRKWYKYINYGEKPFPCACPTRVEDCIFIELYNELDKLTELHKNESYFKSELLNYEQIEGDSKAALGWLERNEAIGRRMYFNKDEEGNIRLSVVKSPEPYITLKVVVDKQNFKSLLELKDLYSKLNNEVIKFT